MPLNDGAVNDILLFAPEGTEASGDLMALADYGAHTDRLRGHQAGLAKRALENRVLRQTSLVAAGVAQFIANRYATGVHDNADIDAIEDGLVATIAVMIGAAAFRIPALPTAASATDDDILAIADGGGTHRKIAVADLFAGRGGVDHLARDQIALTNLRQILATSVTTGALVQGKQWELSADEWGASSTGQIYTSGPPGYYSNPGLHPVAPTGTAIGNMTDNAPAAAAFAGADYKALAAAPYKLSTPTAWIGMDWGGSPPANIAQIEIFSTADQGFKNIEDPSIMITIREAATAPGFGVGAALGAATVADANGQKVTITLSSPLSLRNTIIDFSGGTSTHSLQVSKIVFSASLGGDMTLVSPSVALSAPPSYASLYFLHKDDSGAAVLGTDLIADLGRAEGAWTPAEISVLAAYDGSYSLLRARANLSGQPIGTSLTGRITTLNGKVQRVAAPALYAE